MDAVQLQRLEEASWRTESARVVYSTSLIPGFPWYTVCPPPHLHGQSTRRHVIPYMYTFRVFVKGRWVGRELVDVYAEEHTHHSREYYQTCLERGRLKKVSGSRCNIRRSWMKRSHTMCSPSEAGTGDEGAAGVSGPLQHGDVILHSVHRHEIPVSMGKTGVDPIVLAAVRISDYGILVVHKPAGLPTHASGRYFMNSCTSMLEYVLAPRRLRSWLIEEDPLLQSLVSTTHLTDKERTELLALYLTSTEKEDAVLMERLPRPCYRLDKVTSGVLLFGVSTAAARRIGEALMRKTQQMEHILTQKLRFEGNKDAITYEILHASGVGVRKRYLARVRGAFPENAMERLSKQSSERKKGCTWGDACEKFGDHCSSDGLLVVTSGSGKGYTETNSEEGPESLVPFLGLPVLLTSPLRQSRFSETETTGGNCSDGNGVPIKEGFYQGAMTFCQPLRQFGVSIARSKGTETGVESLVHCVPFSGRMHQIRMHLSDWAHPIVGDATYGGGERGCDRQILSFSTDELPRSFRDAFYASDELCWECVGKLPVASFDASNGANIALHAWQYEMDHQSLLTNEGVGVTEAVAEQQLTGGDEGSPPSLECCYEEVVCTNREFVRRQGSFVIFFSPPPSWAVA